MVLNIKLLNTNLKPVFDTNIPGIDKPIQALIDTGSMKTIWCSEKFKLDEDNLKSFKFKDTGETTTLSGFGVGDQKDCKIYKGNFNIYRNSFGIAFKDIEIVESKKVTLAYDMILPYPLFRKFEYTFRPATPDAKYGKLIIDTLGNKVIYGVTSAGGVVIDTYAEENTKVQNDEDIKEEVARRVAETMEELKEKSVRQVLDEKIKTLQERADRMAKECARKQDK